LQTHRPQLSVLYTFRVPQYTQKGVMAYTTRLWVQLLVSDKRNKGLQGYQTNELADNTWDKFQQDGGDSEDKRPN